MKKYVSAVGITFWDNKRIKYSIVVRTELMMEVLRCIKEQYKI